jgi:hypothetical protein
MSTILNRNQEQESAMIMSAIKRYFGESSQSPGATGSDSSLLEALNAYFRDRNEA